MRVPRYRAGAIGAALYLLVCIFAAAYPIVSKEMFAGLPAVMLAWPWTDYLAPGRLPVFLAVALNAFLIYFALGVLTALFSKEKT